MNPRPLALVVALVGPYIALALACGSGDDGREPFEAPPRGSSSGADARSGASKYDDKGKLTEKSLVDAQMALLARVSGKYFDKDGTEICKNEVDPNQVLATVLGKLVTPIKDGDFKGQSPLEMIIDVIADVNRIDPSEEYDGTLQQKDYASVSKNVVEFLVDPQRGLEQFYEVIRQGTKF